MDFCDRHILTFLHGFESNPKGGPPLDFALSRYFRAHKNLGATDRRVIGNTLFGMTRWKSLLDHLCPTSDPAKRLAAYQQISWESIETDASIPEWARCGMSAFLYSRFTSHFGPEKTAVLSRLFNTPAPVVIRANLLKTTRDDLLRRFKNSFSCFPCERAPAGIQFHKREPLFCTPEFKEGFFEVQDEGSQLVAGQVQARPGDLVLDYCSGSGGKTLAFAPGMQRKGQIFLTDLRQELLYEARRRLKRAGVENAQTLPLGSPRLRRILGKCDWVLIDVPCSGTGTLRRNPDQKWKLDGLVLDRLVAQQRDIATNAIAFLKPGGRLVYATCSLLPEENHNQVDFFLQHLPLSLEQKPQHLWPEVNGMDGFFSAVFRKQTVC